MKSFIIAVVGIVSFLYLLNMSMGMFEFLPDNIPLVGNVDEVMATTLLLSSLAYFGFDLNHFFKREDKKEYVIKDAEYEK